MKTARTCSHWQTKNHII